MAAFQQRQATPKKDQAYRGSIRKYESSDDDSSDLSDSESDDEQSWKRRKSAPAPPPTSHRIKPPSESHRSRERPVARSSRPDAAGHASSRSLEGRGDEPNPKRRRNNIWGSVVAEQNQETVERELTQFGVEADLFERDVESYYKPTQQPQLGLVANLPEEPVVQRGRKIVKEVGEEEDDAWLAEQSHPHQDGEDEEEEGGLEKTAQPDLRDRLMKQGSMVADKFRRSNIKSRLGAKQDGGQQQESSSEEEEETIMKSVEIDPSSGSKVIAGQLAYSLQEPKRNLMLRIVKILGVNKAIEIWKRTEEIEHDGGMMIRNQSRRRTPGGVFLQLMKLDPDVTPDDVKNVFAEEKATFEAEKKKRRRHTRKHKECSSMDVDRLGNENAAEERMEDAGDEPDGAGQGVVVDRGCLDAIEGNSSGEEEELASINKPGTGHKNWNPVEEGAREGAHSVPFPLQEYDAREKNLREHNDGILSFMPDIKEKDIPKRNEDSEPEDGEVIDDDDDD